MDIGKTKRVVLLSEYLGIDKSELESMGVFNSIVNLDSEFYINILRLKNTTVEEFKNSYNRINSYFKDIITLLDNSEKRGDVFYRNARQKFDFRGIKEINLGLSATGVDSGFRGKLADQVVMDAFDIVKKGVKRPEIFHLVGLFEKGVGADRISDMIGYLIYDDIREYTKNINNKLQITKELHPKLIIKEGIVFNEYKNCELLYLPIDILHEIPIARSWEEIGNVISKNKTIRDEMSEQVLKEWEKYTVDEKKLYIKEMLLNPEKCNTIIDSYLNTKIDPLSIYENVDYCYHCVINNVIDAVHSFKFEKQIKTSKDVSMYVLKCFKDFIENKKGWLILQEVGSKNREIIAQELLHAVGDELLSILNYDPSFEANEGRGPVDLKISRGNDKTIIEIKLSSNSSYLHGYTTQIEEYAKAENANNKIFVFIIMEEGDYDKVEKLNAARNEIVQSGKTPAEVFVVNAIRKASASKY